MTDPEFDPKGRCDGTCSFGWHGPSPREELIAHFGSNGGPEVFTYFEYLVDLVEAEVIKEWAPEKDVFRKIVSWIREQANNRLAINQKWMQLADKLDPDLPPNPRRRGYWNQEDWNGGV